MSKEEIINLLREKHLRITPQRIAVLEYIYDKGDHPDALDVWENVSKLYPNFSKTTVYNALKSLVDCGLLIPITINGESIHYDVDVSPHGHFICQKCSKIYDFNVNSVNFSGLDGFVIDKKAIYYSGICKRCSENINN